MAESAVTFERTSLVDAPVAVVWERVVSAEGINDEMRPWLTMTMPRGFRHLDVTTVPVGVSLGRAWLRLFGVLPFDYDELTVAELDPGRRFREVSSMGSLRRWEHERTLTERGRSTVVTDRVTFEPRIAFRWARPLLIRVIAAFFAHRHRRLARHFVR